MLQKLCSAPDTLGFSSTFCFDFKYSSFEMRTPAKFSMIQKFFVSQRHQIKYVEQKHKQKLTKFRPFILSRYTGSAPRPLMEGSIWLNLHKT